MNNRNYIKINLKAGLVDSLSTLSNSTYKKAGSINLVLAFFMPHIQLKTILEGLIISKLKQKLTIYPNDFINSQSCSVPLSTTLNCILSSELIEGALQVAI